MEPRFFATTIRVSGYPPIPATAYAQGGVLVVTATRSGEVMAFLARQQRVATSATGTASETDGPP